MIMPSTTSPMLEDDLVFLTFASSLALGSSLLLLGGLMVVSSVIRAKPNPNTKSKANVRVRIGGLGCVILGAVLLYIPVEESPTLIKAAGLFSLVIIASTIGFLVLAAILHAMETRRRISMATAKAWNKLITHEKTLSSRWLAYEDDPVLAERYPLMRDRAEPVVLNVIDAMGRAKALRPVSTDDPDVDPRTSEYARAVVTFEQALEVAERRARTMRKTTLVLRNSVRAARAADLAELTSRTTRRITTWLRARRGSRPTSRDRVDH